MDTPTPEISVGRYYTRCGLIAEVIEIVELNSTGNMVTFPVKGYVHTTRRTTGKKKPVYTIWTADGHFGVIGQSKWDLVEKLV